MAQNWSVKDDLVKGNDLNLYLVKLASGETMSDEIVANTGKTKVIAYATSCSFEISSDSIDVTSKLSCRWNANVQGNASYTISSDALYCLQAAASANGAYTVDDLFEAMCEGDNVGWVMAVDLATAQNQCGTILGPDTSGICYYGEGAITSLSITAGNNEIASSSIQITGSGRPWRYGEQD
jgi:hypothetical protein